MNCLQLKPRHLLRALPFKTSVPTGLVFLDESDAPEFSGCFCALGCLYPAAFFTFAMKETGRYLKAHCWAEAVALLIVQGWEASGHSKTTAECVTHRERSVSKLSPGVMQMSVLCNLRQWTPFFNCRWEWSAFHSSLVVLGGALGTLSLQNPLYLCLVRSKYRGLLRLWSSFRCNVNLCTDSCFLWSLVSSALRT